MTVLRIIANIATSDVTTAEAFYGEVLGLEKLMDHGWIVTYGNATASFCQVSFATEGGSGTPVPDISVEVDNLDEVLWRVENHGFALEYGPADEPWGVRRFFVRDPFGRLVNVLMHQ